MQYLISQVGHQIGMRNRFLDAMSLMASDFLGAYRQDEKILFTS